MIVHRMLVCRRFLISVCMFIVSKALLISSATAIIRADGTPFLRCCLMCVGVVFCNRVVWLCLVYLLLCKEEGSSPVSAMTERRDMGLYEVHLSMSLLGFGMGTMLANFHMCGIMLVLRAVFNILVRNMSPRGLMCFRYLMFIWQDPVSCYFYFVYYLLDMSCGECHFISLYFL